MQNDVLKNKIAPWQEKGRWYHGVVDCTTNKFIQEKTDAFLLDSNNFLQTLNASSNTRILEAASFKIKILDYHIKLSDDFTASIAFYGGIAGLYMGGTTYGVGLYPNATAGSVEVWLFVVES